MYVLPSARAIRVALMGLALAALGGCAASPRVVTAITSSRDQVKFLYVEGSDQGVIKCKVGGDGSLGQCRQMAVTFED
jgi:hypothetical protein